MHATLICVSLGIVPSAWGESYLRTYERTVVPDPNVPLGVGWLQQKNTVPITNQVFSGYGEYQESSNPYLSGNLVFTHEGLSFSGTCITPHYRMLGVVARIEFSLSQTTPFSITGYRPYVGNVSSAFGAPGYAQQSFKLGHLLSGDTIADHFAYAYNGGSGSGFAHMPEDWTTNWDYDFVKGTLGPGDYYLELLAERTSGIPGSQYWSNTFAFSASFTEAQAPAPGGLALLLAAGFTSRRRKAL